MMIERHGHPAHDPSSREWKLAWPAPVAVVLAVLVLRWLGRGWWCGGGEYFLWSGAGQIQTLHNSQHLADPYTLTHVLHGLGLYLLWWGLAGRRLEVAARGGLAVASEALWEVVENTPAVIERYRESTITFGYYGYSVFNSLGDIAACVLGFWLAAKLPVRLSLVLFLAIEALLLLWIRDSLLLNVLMLVWPSQAIRAWQAG